MNNSTWLISPNKVGWWLVKGPNCEHSKDYCFEYFEHDEKNVLVDSNGLSRAWYAHATTFSFIDKAVESHLEKRHLKENEDSFLLGQTVVVHNSFIGTVTGFEHRGVWVKPKTSSKYFCGTGQAPTFSCYSLHNVKAYKG